METFFIPVLRLAIASGFIACMIILNVDAVLQRAALEKKKPKPLPKVVIAKKPKPVDRVVAERVNKTLVNQALDESKSGILQQLWKEFSEVKNARNHESTQIAIMVDNGATQPQLKSHYDKIEGFRPQLQDLYDKIEFVERHGYLPVAPETTEEEETVWSLKVKRDQLIDERYKLRKRIETRFWKTQEKYVAAELRLAQANAEFMDIQEKIKKMEGKA